MCWMRFCSRETVQISKLRPTTIYSVVRFRTICFTASPFSDECGSPQTPCSVESFQKSYSCLESTPVHFTSSHLFRGHQQTHQTLEKVVREQTYLPAVIRALHDRIPMSLKTKMKITMKREIKMMNSYQQIPRKKL